MSPAHSIVHDPSLLLQSVIYLGAAILAVPISKRIGLGSVLGYLIAGIMIGPWGLGFISEVETVLHFAEFGVVMMLFLIGLELNLDKLWQLRAPIFGLGGLQVLVTLAVVTGAGMVLGFDWRLALVAGMGVAMSSTAIAVQTMVERGEMEQPSGHAAFAVLLFQDLSVIPLMLMLSLLVVGEHAGVDWMAAGRALLLVLTIVLGGNYLLRPVLRYIANTGLREIFIAFALFLVMGVAILMEMVGLSMALGAFLAGVLLADSEYRQELELDIEPFKGLLLGLFFIAVGMSVDLGLVWHQPILIFGLALLFVGLKVILLFPMARLFKLNAMDAVMFAFTLSQIGEFAFVIFNTAQQQSVLSAHNTSLLNAVVAVSMLTTPLLMLAHQAWLRHRINLRTPQPHETIDVQSRVIVAGFGRVGQVVTRLLNGINIKPTVIEQDPNQIELVRQYGFKAYYGDISRVDVLEAAGIGQAQLLVLAIDDHEDAVKAAKYVRERYPHVRILARTRNRSTAFDLMDMQVDSVRETFFSSLHLGELALRALGYGAYQATKTVWRFRMHDEHLLNASHPIRHDVNKLIAQSHQARKDLSQLLGQEDREQHRQIADDGWNDLAK